MKGVRDARTSMGERSPARDGPEPHTVFGPHHQLPRLPRQPLQVTALSWGKAERPEH